MRSRPLEDQQSLCRATSRPPSSPRRLSTQLLREYTFETLGVPPLIQLCRAYGGINHLVNNAGFTADKVRKTRRRGMASS